MTRLFTKILLFCGLLVSIIAAGFAQTAGAFENAIVKGVVDGDTIYVVYKNQEESIRLIGIDTPESSTNDKALKDAERTHNSVQKITTMGKQAAKYVRTLVKRGDKIGIEFDVQKRDEYGRMLCYVHLSDGTMLNEKIIRAGYARPMTHPPNVRYQHIFSKAYKEARENRRGLFRY